MHGWQAALLPPPLLSLLPPLLLLLSLLLLMLLLLLLTLLLLLQLLLMLLMHVGCHPPAAPCTMPSLHGQHHKPSTSSVPCAHHFHTLPHRWQCATTC